MPAHAERGIFPAMRASEMEGGRYQVNTRLGVRRGAAPAGGHASGGPPHRAAPAAAVVRKSASPAFSHRGAATTPHKNGSTPTAAASARLQAYGAARRREVQQQRGFPYEHDPHAGYINSGAGNANGADEHAAVTPHRQRLVAPHGHSSSTSHPQAPPPSSSSAALLPTTPGGTATVPRSVSEQLQLFTSLQQTVVQLSQCAVEDKKRISELQRAVESYQGLVDQQDQMLEELKKVNVKLQAERDALVAFRQSAVDGTGNGTTASRIAASAGGAAVVSTHRGPPSYHSFAEAFGSHESGGADGGHASSSPSSSTHVDVAPAAPGVNAGPSISFTPQGDLITTSGDPFTRSLIEQLRAEKRQRLAVEEQASRLMAEQQLLILRLEERYNAVRPSSPITGTPRRPVGGTSGAVAGAVAPAIATTSHTAALGERLPAHQATLGVLHDLASPPPPPLRRPAPNAPTAATTTAARSNSSSTGPRSRPDSPVIPGPMLAADAEAATATAVAAAAPTPLEEPSADRGVREGRSERDVAGAAVDFAAALEHELPK